jgi:hypothetical protein
MRVKGSRWPVRLTVSQPSVSRLSEKMWKPRRLTVLRTFTASDMLQVKLASVKTAKFNSFYFDFKRHFTMGPKLIYFYRLNYFADNGMSYMALTVSVCFCKALTYILFSWVTIFISLHSFWNWYWLNTSTQSSAYPQGLTWGKDLQWAHTIVAWNSSFRSS